MSAKRTCCHKMCAALLFAMVCLSGAFASPCPVCSKWEGQSFHDAQVSRGGRCKQGTIPKGYIPSLNKSTDTCIAHSPPVIVPHNSPSGYRRCPKCFGKGEIPDKIENQKEEADPASKDANPVKKENEKKASVDPSVVLVGVKKCDKCDANGKIAQTIDCSLCDAGFNHKKDGDAFKCRVCGKAGSSRFAPCCKPDCPECGNKRGVNIGCPVCGGDKVITPLEEARNKEPPTPAAAKQ